MLSSSLAARGAEQLGGGERGRDRAEVEGEVRPAPAGRGLVNGPRHQLLAGAGLAAQEHRRPETAGPPDGAAQVDHGGARAGQSLGLGLVRRRNRQEVEEERDPLGEDQRHAALEVGRQEHVGRRDAEHFEPAAPGIGGDPGRPRPVAGGEEDRAAAEVEVGQRPRRAPSGRREQRRPPRQLDREAGGERRQEDALAHAAGLRMRQDGQRRDLKLHRRRLAARGRHGGGVHLRSPDRLRLGHDGPQFKHCPAGGQGGSGWPRRRFCHPSHTRNSAPPWWRCPGVRNRTIR
jgi:hypothetical protein